MTRILVVEDDDECRSAVRELLETHGFEVSEACDGAAALACLMSMQEPSLVVLDLEMPVMSGAELIDVMRRYYRLSQVPVLILSGSQRAVVPPRSAVVGVISKPFDASTFVETVMNHVRK